MRRLALAALLLAALLLAPGLAAGQALPAPANPPPLTAEPPRLTPPPLGIAPPRLPAPASQPEAAAMDPGILIVPDATLHAHIRLFRAPEGVDPGIFLRPPPAPAAPAHPAPPAPRITPVPLGAPEGG